MRHFGYFITRKGELTGSDKNMFVGVVNNGDMSIPEKYRDRHDSVCFVMALPGEVIRSKIFLDDLIETLRDMHDAARIAERGRVHEVGQATVD